MTEQPVPAVHFATSLVPHRSLSPAGFRWLIWAAIAANLAIGLPMLIVGAWPVLGFMGLDIWLLWFLFKRSYLDARRSETLVLTDRELIVDRVAPDGEREQHRLDAYWLRVELSGEAERLVVVSRGNRAGDRPLPGAGRARARGRAAEGRPGRDARAALRARLGLTGATS